MLVLFDFILFFTACDFSCKTWSWMVSFMLDFSSDFSDFYAESLAVISSTCCCTFLCCGLSLCRLSHSCLLLKPFDGFRYH